MFNCALIWCSLILTMILFLAQIQADRAQEAEFFHNLNKSAKLYALVWGLVKYEV